MTKSAAVGATLPIDALPPDRSRDVLVVTGSPSTTSRSEKLGERLTEAIGSRGHNCRHMKLRILCPEALLSADVSHPEIVEALDLIEHAHGVVVVTPTYKGTFSGLFKTFVDMLPQYALRSKIILPLATGGSPAHVLMLDYGLRPVLQTMWPKQVIQGCFIVDGTLAFEEGFDIASSPRLSAVFAEFMDALSV